MEKKIEELLKEAITHWVAENFGSQEAEDPSWNIDALAHDLANNRVLDIAIYQAVNRDYMRDDCEMIAERHDIKLAEDELNMIVDDFMDSEAYVDIPEEDWLYFIQKVKGDEE